METILLEAVLSDCSPPVRVRNPFKDKAAKKLDWRWRTKRTSKAERTEIGKIQLFVRKSEGQTDDDPTYWLRFVNVQVTNDRDLPLYVLLSRSAANDLEDTAAVKQLESTAETILLDDGPEGQWKGTQLRPTMEQELRLFDVMAFSSIIICKPSAAKPPSVQPLIFAYGVFQSYTPPEKSAAQILQETNALAEELMHTMIDMEQDELRDQDDLALDALQRNAKQLFRMFDEDKSNSIDFEEYKQMLAYRKLNLLESKARRFFDLVDDQKKGYIDEREFVVALYITNFLRQASKGSNSTAQSKFLSPADVFRQLDADQDELLNRFEYEKALELLGIDTRARTVDVRLLFPKHGSMINLEQFKHAWLHLIDVREELKRRNIDPASTPDIANAIKIATVDDNTGNIPGRPRHGILAALVSKPGNKQAKELDRLRQLLLSSLDKLEQEELIMALKAKEEVIITEKQQRMAADEERHARYQKQRHEATQTRTNEALRERQDKITRKKERVIKERQAKEERRLRQLMEEARSKRKAHEMHVAQELIATKMEKIVTQKARCGDDVLDYGGRQLKELPAFLYHGRDALTNLSSLLVINLSRNKLQTLPNAIFAHLFNLKSLDLSDNELESLPNELGEARDLELLDLRSNQLKELPLQLSLLHRLKVLHLAYNQLSAFGDISSGLQALEELNLCYNPLTSLSESIGFLSALKILRLRGNVQLKKLPNSIHKLRNLVHWDFSGCEQKRLGNDVLGMQLSNLRSLNLSHNYFAALPSRIGEVSTLQELYLSSNRILVLPTDIKGLQDLVTLYCDRNNMHTLPESIGALRSLECLSLTHNQLLTIPANIGLLTSLCKLNLDNNRLQQIPLEIGALVNLRDLSLAWNELTALPEEIGCLSDLQEVNLSNNQLTQLPDAIVLWQKLQKLRCHHNLLQTPLTPSLGALQSLQYVDISHNQLRTMESCIYNPQHLEVLNLSANRITLLPQDMAMRCPRLKKLDLYNNKLAALPVEIGPLLARLDVFSIGKNPMQYLPEKWSDQWRLQDQYTTAFSHGYTAPEVVNWVADQSVCYPIILRVWRQLVSSDSNNEASPQRTFGSDDFVKQVRSAMGEAIWQNRFDWLVRYSFYEFLHLGHERAYSDDVPPSDQEQHHTIELQRQSQRQQRADQACHEHEAFRAQLDASYRVHREHDRPIEKRRLYEQKLLADVRHETRQLNTIVDERATQLNLRLEQHRQQQRKLFAEEMKGLARERLLQKRIAIKTPITSPAELPRQTS